MEFFIKKNATLPVLKMQVVKDGRSDYNNFMDFIEESSIFFSMTDLETGIPKLVTRPAGFTKKEFMDPNTPVEYYVYYQFQSKDTNKVGRYEGQFLFRTEEGVLILPIREKLYINIQESFIADDLPYENCYVSEFPCCIKTPVVPVTTTTTTIPVTTTTTTTFLEIESEFPLGRTHKPDERDNNYLIENHLLTTRPTKKLTSRYWDDNGWWGNQGNTPQCVGYSWAHWLEDGPVSQSGVAPIIQPRVIYENAQKLDEWPGENYDGTSVRGGVKYLQKMGKVKNYYWGYSLQTLIDTVLNVGPVVVGTNWYNNMFYPDRRGIIRVGGRLAGGHAYLINGVDTNKKLFRLKNSWGRNWGQYGSAYISFSDMERLIKEYGEICFATEISS
jgi:hypothetical protein